MRKTSSVSEPTNFAQHRLDRLQILRWLCEGIACGCLSLQNSGARFCQGSAMPMLSASQLNFCRASATQEYCNRQDQLPLRDDGDPCAKVASASHPPTAVCLLNRTATWTLLPKRRALQQPLPQIQVHQPLCHQHLSSMRFFLHQHILGLVSTFRLLRAPHLVTLTVLFLQLQCCLLLRVHSVSALRSVLSESLPSRRRDGFQSLQ
mmetsp:Transcript_1540/g.4657  ORF Transcript_1540/g.4657 Transcript_1540/m.4657 type:complete len:206 (+) Transcript_1540:250-867(+)